ncbi:hypothetical protein PUR71_07310 [Streptomyces sp. SP17BM10]|uniref:hypothetical protein n=1 Tax=Streptomyces sp. SP17BM10 TaxID=3002530 RepID=UPI002E7A70EC|nr:hypothetical protein [Streptomyces sp. SP17BM10]MEE1782729.1 hypothetical protein [Streptomyces sp. SP17BM10]
MAHALASHNEALGVLVGRLAEIVGHAAAGSEDWTFEDFDREVAIVESAQREAELRKQRLADLSGRVAKYDALLADEDDEEARAALVMVRDNYLEQLAALGVVPAQAAPPNAPAHHPASSKDMADVADSAGVGVVEELSGLAPQAEVPCGERLAVSDGTQSAPAAESADGPVDEAPSAGDDARAAAGAADAGAASEPATDTLPSGEAAPQTGAVDGAAADGAFGPAESGAATQQPERDIARPVVLPWSGSGGGAGPVADLISQRRLAEAYWFTRGSDESDLRAETMAFVEAAFACASEPSGTAVLSAFNRTAAEFRDDRGAQIAALVASLRAGLAAGWPNDILNQPDYAAGMPEDWTAFVDAAVNTVRHCQRVSPAPGWLVHTSPGVTREQIGDLARELLADLPRRRTSYERATQVLARLAAADQPLGRTLQVIADWADGAAAAGALEDAAAAVPWLEPDRLIIDADLLVRNPRQAREPIEAKARRSLLRAITSVSDLLDQARNIAASQAGTRLDVAATLRSALAAASAAQPLPGVEGTLLELLCQWLRGDAPVREHQFTARADGLPEDLGDYRPDSRPLLALTGLPRHPDGSPDPDAPGFAAALLPLLDDVDAHVTALAHCALGDVHLAEALAAAVAQGAVPAVPSDTLPAHDLAAAIDTAHGEWSARLRADHAAASGLLAELRIQRTLDPATERELTGELARLEQPRPAGAYRPAIEDIGALTERMHTAVRAYAVKLHEEFAALDLDEATRAEVDKLLELHDTATAEEYLALIKHGEPLPDWGTVDWGADLAAFSTGLGLDPKDGRLQQGYSARPWARHYAGGSELTEGVQPALEAWEALCDSSTRNQEWQRHLPRVLRLLGLEAEPSRLAHADGALGQIRATLRAAGVTESRPGYVASLGSRAQGRYNVVIVSDRQVGRTVLDLLDDNDSTATIILYLYPMDLAARRALVARARTGMRQALVVDPAVIGWIAARYPRSFRATQRVTLPWSAFNTYTPFVAGLVPPEVFYGRREEMTQVVDPLGGLFLYGGRQLGKSALLRRVEATYPTERHKAVYLDLNAYGVGQAEPAERLWPVLAAELRRVGVLPDRAKRPDDAPDVVVGHIERWLAGDPERRLLVLLDESDAFLTADSRSVNGLGGEGTFPNVLRLKRLMESTERRFKVVFAGLHQVQRFSHLSNVPLVHGGPDVLVGPLSPAEAQRLVVEPMAALGFVFERPELVWRVLAATNFLASLVQIFCEQLVSALRSAPVEDTTWPIVVTEADLRSVSASAHVRAQIADRMRITINLEDRYRVLALVIALRSLEDGYRNSYGPAELLQEARERWPEGFRELTASQMQIYLQEMVGLGLLVRQPGDDPSYAVRSPNVVSMLGTPEALELELTETEFRLPYEYNPRFSRRMVGEGRSAIQRYSPLTEEQLSAVTGPGVSAVSVSDIFEPALVVSAVEAYAAARNTVVVRASGANHAKLLAAPQQDDQLLLVDLRGRDQDELSAALELLGAAGGTQGPGAGARRAVVLVHPDAALGRNDVIGNAIRPQRWSADSLRAWPECPFDTPQQRRQLVEATGGWPSLVEMTVHQVTRTGTPLETALEKVRALTESLEWSRGHLRRIGLDADLARLLTGWTQLLDEPEPDTPARIASIIGVPESRILDLVARLTGLGVLDEHPQGIALDPVTFRALATLTDGA